MNCKICFNQYDHSVHKPYMLSCPHTFCISCINKFKTNKCPTCSLKISAKHPNIELLELVPESMYDQLKVTSEKALNEINEIKSALKSKSEAKLNKCLNKINSARCSIKNETKKFVKLVKTSEENFLSELNEIELKVKKELTSTKEEILEAKIRYEKHSIEKNLFSEEQLTKSIETSKENKIVLKRLERKVEEFKENIQFSVNESVSLKDGMIAKIETNDKVIFFHIK